MIRFSSLDVGRNDQRAKFLEVNGAIAFLISTPRKTIISQAWMKFKHSWSKKFPTRDHNRMGRKIPNSAGARE